MSCGSKISTWLVCSSSTFLVDRSWSLSNR
jgi:hypothetical protein